jgi:hypothetical protein
MKWFLNALAFVLCSTAFLPVVYAQEPESLSIWDAYRLAREQYPASQRRELIERTREPDLQSAATGVWPRLRFGGQAGLQSDATGLPGELPGESPLLPTLSRVQFNMYGELEQVVYDGGNWTWKSKVFC